MPAEPRSLTDRERAIIDFEREWLVAPTGSSKEQAIREQLGISGARFYELLKSLLDEPAAMDYDPLVIRRRKRSLDERRRQRFEGRSAGPSAR
jgi:hypothetical protein